jgi:hypothetical protein
MNGSEAERLLVTWFDAGRALELGHQGVGRRRERLVVRRRDFDLDVADPKPSEAAT